MIRKYGVWLLVLLFLGVAVANQRRAARHKQQLHRVQEAATLAEEGYLAAEEGSKRVLNRSIATAVGLKEEVERLTRLVDAKPRSVTKWKTNPINIDMQRELDRLRSASPPEPERIEVPVPFEVEGECEWVGLPDFVVEVSGAEAHLETDEGNYVAVGVVEVSGGFDGLESDVLGSAPFSVSGFDITPPRRPLRNALALGLTTATGFDARYSRLLTKRRLGVYAGVQYDRDPLTVTGVFRRTYNWETVVADDVRFYGGLELRF